MGSQNVRKPLKCSVCPWIFTDKHQLDKHQLVHTDVRPYECPLCGATFKRADCLKRHHRLSHLATKKKRGGHKIKSEAEYRSRSVSCPICGVSLYAKGALPRHIFQTHDPAARSLGCCICGRFFNNVHSLRSHIDHVHAASVIPCTLCTQRFKTAWSRDLHFRMVHSSDRIAMRFRCLECPKAFQLSCSLQSHRRTHTNERPYACEICAARFKDKGHFSQHLELHRLGGQRPVLCELCDGSFRTKMDLGRHVRGVHLKGPEIRCRLCSRVFSHKDTLRDHLKAKHAPVSERTLFRCALCVMLLQSRSSLRNHLSTIHAQKRQHWCARCGAAYSNLYTLSVHLKERHLASAPPAKKPATPAGCSRCLLRFVKKCMLKRHLAEAHHVIRLEIACGACPQMFLTPFDLKRHEQRAHSAEMPFRCERCPRRFNFRCRLREHMQTSHRTIR